MKIENKKVVELCYELEVDGQIVDRTTKEKPLDYIHGTRSLLPKFEENIEGMEPGSKFQFTLTPEEGYGEVDPNRVIDLPKEAFEVNGEIREDLLQAGNTVPLLNSAGQVVPGVILEVCESTVKMDLNSPMAGKTLNFSGEILTVRDATEKELTEGLHGEYIQSNCGCGGHHHHGECGCHEGGEDCGCHGEGHGDCGCGEGHGDCGCHGEGHGDCGCHGEGHGDCGCHDREEHGEGHCHHGE
ncbi:MAG: peptidylprolyl isomerase [Bacteroidales bacterium]|nr:peptidylprolyl isomerase [Bacteroidales bacterium]